MKKIFGFLALGLLLAVSCEKEGPMTVNHITDLYTAPDGATVMQLSKAESQWATDRRYFNLDFSNLSTTLVGYDALLAPGQYLIGADQIGSAINTKVNGQTPGKGWITVNEKDGQYQITATFDGKVYYWTGSLPFSPDPAPTKLVEVLSAQSNKGNGVNSLTMNLSTGGFSQGYDENWQQVWTGAGNYLALDIYSDDGYLHDGTYTACAEGGVINPGEFGIGYDTQIEWDGQVYPMLNWGTCWWTVANGAATAEKITSGLVSVTSREEKVDDKDVTIWTIAWGAKYPVEVLFEGAIPALTKPKKPSGPVVPDCLYTDTVTPSEGFDLHAINITDKDGNELAYLELLTENGATDLSGSYPATSYAGQPGQMRDGYDGGSMEYEGVIYEWPGGGSYYVQDGQKKYLYAQTATVAVTAIATGAYNFTCEFFSYNCAGPDYVPEEGGDGGVVLTQFTSLIDYAMFGMNMVGIEMATDGVVATAGSWGKTYSGDGQYLKLEIYAEGGNIEPGVYTPCAEGAGGTLKAFEFNIGYDSSGNPYGSNWFTLTGGASSNEYITDGTVTITGSGDEYTVVLDCSVAKAKYVGPLHE